MIWTIPLTYCTGGTKVWIGCNNVTVIFHRLVGHCDPLLMRMCLHHQHNNKDTTLRINPTSYPLILISFITSHTPSHHQASSYLHILLLLPHSLPFSWTQIEHHQILAIRNFHCFPTLAPLVARGCQSMLRWPELLCTSLRMSRCPPSHQLPSQAVFICKIPLLSRNFNISKLRNFGEIQ